MIGENASGVEGCELHPLAAGPANANQPNLSAAPSILDFRTGGDVSGGINYSNLASGLKQVFFIGDGLTDASVQQAVIVLNGARIVGRLCFSITLLLM